VGDLPSPQKSGYPSSDDSSSSSDHDDYEFDDDHHLGFDGLGHHGLLGTGSLFSGLLFGGLGGVTTTASCLSAGGVCQSALSCYTPHDDHDYDDHLGPVFGRLIGTCNVSGQVVETFSYALRSRLRFHLQRACWFANTYIILYETADDFQFCWKNCFAFVVCRLVRCATSQWAAQENCALTAIDR
jgi:hypothetical protein